MVTILEVKAFGCDMVTPSTNLWDTILEKGANITGIDVESNLELGLCLAFDKSGFDGFGMDLLRHHARQLAASSHGACEGAVYELLTVRATASAEFYRRFYADLFGRDFFEEMIEYLVEDGEPKVFTVFGAAHPKLRPENAVAARLRSYVGKTRWEESDIGTIRHTVIRSATAAAPFFFGGGGVHLNFETYQNVLHCSGNAQEGIEQSRFFIDTVQQVLP